MAESIGILYICTGPYVLFWKEFYESFEKYFLPEFEKRYFVFTDSDKIFTDDNKLVKIVKIDPMPWPLITLLRFSIFLKAENELKKCNYLMFSNANMICNETITPEEFLPRQNESISVTIHPGYYQKNKIEFPYERRKCSTAYIPWNCGMYYVIGAMFCGRSEAFIKMSKTLERNIEDDLKKNIIAKWHDESQLNRYIINKPGVRILGPMYCYPYGMDVTYPKKIYAVSKQAKFDVKSFKGQNLSQQGCIRKYLSALKRKMMIKERTLYLIDSLIGAHAEELTDEE